MSQNIDVHSHTVGATTAHAALINDRNYVTRWTTSPNEINANAWNALLHLQTHPTPFMRHEYLLALTASGSATPATGWAAHYLTLEQDGKLLAACVMHLKTHSYGEYVFDWAWANAYQQHGLQYYPKALLAVPFTPVPGARLMAVNAEARHALLKQLLDWCQSREVSSLHLLFLAEDDVQTCRDHGLMLRHTVQFHWHNSNPGYADFDHFLGSLTQEKRKKIKQERRKVAQAEITFECKSGKDISLDDWEFFYRCYERTYLEHGNAPYLNPDFFQRVAREMPENWLMCLAYRSGKALAASLVALNPADKIAYGRYWGALERVDCLHFEACYYQPLEWCIAHGYIRFEGGAQGEHKMARALLPVKTTSAHWLAHPAFANAVSDFLDREGQHIDVYMQQLEQRKPFKTSI